MDMTMESCRRFVEVLASDAPAPGGGGAAALVGAIGTALGNMVGSLTVGKKKYADVQEEILDLKAKCDALQKELLDQVEADDKKGVITCSFPGEPSHDATLLLQTMELGLTEISKQYSNFCRLRTKEV